MSLLRVFKDRHGIKGFSLIEMLISIVIFSIVMGIIYTYLLRSKEGIFRGEEELKAADNAQVAMRVLREDISRMGIGRDSDKDEPRVLRCEPYSITFVADLDRDRRSKTERWGSWINSLGQPASDPTFRFEPIRNLVTAAGDWGWNTAVDYGSMNDGAEIIRFSLDYNADGKILASDTENAVVIDPDMTHNQNPADFYLIKEIWGCIEDTGQPTGYRNAYSGPQLTAFNVRGNLYDPTNPSMDRSNFIYPNGEWPQVMFTYWGHFINNQTTYDDPSNPNWDGEPLDLWGDWGGNGPPANNYVPAGDVGNGVLSQAEIVRLMTDPSISVVRVLYPEDPMGSTYVETDANGNGVSGEQRLDELIRRIGIKVITETGVPDRKAPNLERSNTTVSPAQYYYFKDFEASITINPENLAYAGLPPMQMTPATSTPNPATPTPRPTYTPTYGPGVATNTPLDTETPTPDITASGTPATPPATETPTPLPGVEYDEIVLGMENFITVVGLNQIVVPPGDPCDLYQQAAYLVFPFPTVTSGRIIEIEEMNICNYPDNPDDYNDVLFASDHQLGTEPNLFYIPHRYPPPIGYFDPLDKSRMKSFRIGPNYSTITKMALGDIDFDSAVPHSLYPEIFTAIRGASPIGDQVFVTGISGPCGGFIDKGYIPYRFPSGVALTDMITADVNHDGFAELIVTTNSVSNAYPQLMVFHNLKQAMYNDWQIVHSYATLFTGESYPVKVQRGGFLHEGTLYPDLLVVSDTGQLLLIQNQGEDTATHEWLGFPSAPCNPIETVQTSVKGVEVFPGSFSGIPYDWASVLSDSQIEQIAQFHKITNLPDCADFDKIASCSGMLFPTGTIAHPTIIDWFDIERGTNNYNVLTVYSELDTVPVSRELRIIRDPCGMLEAFCSLPLNFRVYSMTCIRNAHSSEPINMPSSEKKNRRSIDKGIKQKYPAFVIGQ